MIDKKAKSYSEAFKNAASNLLITNEEEFEPVELPRIEPGPWDPSEWGGLTEEEAFLESPGQVLSDRGHYIASQVWKGGSCSDVYEYKGLFYSQDEVELEGFDNVKAALVRAGIGRDSLDEIEEPHVIKEYAHILENLWSNK